MASASLSRRIEATIVHVARARAGRAATRRPRACARRRGSRRAAPLEPARQRDLDLRLDRMAGERLGSLARAADDDLGQSARGRATPSSGSTTVAPGQDDGELLARDLARACRRGLRVLEADVRQEHDAERRARSSRRAARRGPPRRRRVDAALGELGERGRGQRLELRRAERLRRGTDAGDRALERVAGRCRDARASRSRAATCTRRRRGRRRGTAPRSSAWPSTCRSCRRRGRTGTRAADCRARREARASVRGRTPRARATATRPTVAVNEEAGSGTRGCDTTADARVERDRRRRCSSRPGGASAMQPRSAPQRASACRIARARPRRRASGAVTIDVIPSQLADDDAASGRDSSMRANATSPASSNRRAQRRGARSRASRPRAGASASSSRASSRLALGVRARTSSSPRDLNRDRAPRELVAARGEHGIEPAGRAALRDLEQRRQRRARDTTPPRARSSRREEAYRHRSARRSSRDR